MMTYVPGAPCSETPEIHESIELSESWWAELRRTLQEIRSLPTDRVSVTSTGLVEVINECFERRIDVSTVSWSTAHGDLHWANLRHPQFGLVDWEFWGLAPSGIDEATLYLTSLLNVTQAEQVRTRLRPILENRSGLIAQLYVCARLLRRAADFPDLAPLLRRHGRGVLQRIED